MAQMECVKCERNCIYKSRPKEDEIFGALCDCCEMAFCKECSGLTTTESHAVALTQRSLLFYCQSCKGKKKELSDQLEKYQNELKKKDHEILKSQDSHEEMMWDLKNQLKTALHECERKDEHIQRLKRRTQDFTDCVVSTEQDYIKVIDRQKVEIAHLNKEIVSSMKRSVMLDEEMDSLRCELKKLTSEYSQLNSLKDQMLDSIRVLSGDNEMYMKDLKEASYKIFQLKEAIMESKEPKDTSATNFIPESSPMTFDVIVNRIKTSDKDNNSKKVLILGDECVKGLRPHLVKLLKAKYAVQAIIKAGVIQFLNSWFSFLILNP